MPSDNCFIDSVHILDLLFVGRLLHCKLLYHGWNQKSQIYWTFHSIFMYVNLDSVCHLLAILSYFKSLFHFLDILKMFFHITCHIILTSEFKIFFWIVSAFFPSWELLIFAFLGLLSVEIILWNLLESEFL